MVATRRNKIDKEIARKGYSLQNEFKPKTSNQEKYAKSIQDNVVTICNGVAGTGKTACAVGMACKFLSGGAVDRIIVTRPTVEASKRGIGYLTGDMLSKVSVYMVPVMEELKHYLGHLVVEDYIHHGTIEVAPIEFCRGRNFTNAAVILDESQNCTLQQIKLILTRLNRNSKCILSGDVNQCDIPDSGFQTVIDRLAELEGVGIVYLGLEDICRNDIIGKILRRLETKES